MKETTVGSRYALAIYEIASDLKKVEETYKELKVVMEVYEQNLDFKNFVEHPLVNKKDKKDFVGKIFDGEFSEETTNILNYLIDKNRLSQIKSIVTEYLKLYYSRNQIVEAEVTFAVTPTTEQIDSLSVKLKAKVNKEVRLTTKVDKSILGGLIVRIGDQIIDASIKREIESFRKNY